MNEDKQINVTQTIATKRRVMNEDKQKCHTNDSNEKGCYERR